MSIQPKQFRRVGECHAPQTTTTESGYILGSHIRKGLYEPVNPEISGLMRGVYDDPTTTEVDPLCSYQLDKFEKAQLVRSAPVTATPTPSESPTEN